MAPKVSALHVPQQVISLNLYNVLTHCLASNSCCAILGGLATCFRHQLPLWDHTVCMGAQRGRGIPPTKQAARKTVPQSGPPAAKGRGKAKAVAAPAAPKAKRGRPKKAVVEEPEEEDEVTDCAAVTAHHQTVGTKTLVSTSCPPPHPA